MMTIRDYAAKKGCTVQNIYKLLKKYNDVVGDHVTKIGSKTFLDDAAQVFLDAYITPKSVMATEDELMKEINKLRGLLSESDHKANLLKQENADMAIKLQKFDSERRLLQQDINTLETKFEDAEKRVEEQSEAIEKKNNKILELEKEIEKRDKANPIARLLKKW